MRGALSILPRERPPVPMVIDLNMLITILYAVVAVMIIVVLYQVLFIMWDVRKIARRFEDLSSQVEAVLLKPLSLADHGVQWLVDFIESKAKHHRKKHHKTVEHEEASEERESE